MMDTGERFNFTTVAHMKLARGGAVYVGRCEDFGITVTDRRDRAGEPWRRTFTADATGDREFGTLRACIAALREVAAAVAA